MSDRMTYDSYDEDLGGAYGRPYQAVFGPGGIAGDDARPSNSIDLPYDAMFGPTQMAAAGSSPTPTQMALSQRETPLTPEQMAQLEAHLQNPNVLAYLSVIANAEGATYDTLISRRVGDARRFTDYSRYPGETSGRYQIQPPTYQELRKRLQIDDYSPHTQDLMAVQKLVDRHVIDQIVKGDVLGTLDSASREWAALPEGRGRGSRYPRQPALSSDQVQRLFDLYRAP